MALTRVQRDAISLVGLIDNPNIAYELVDCWAPGHLRDVVLALAAAIDVGRPASELWPVAPRSARRLHGESAGPHRCDRGECVHLNRQWEADYRRAKRTAAKRDRVAV